jgi:hypothetical protein
MHISCGINKLDAVGVIPDAASAGRFYVMRMSCDDAQIVIW